MATYDILSIHRTIAIFEGIKHLPCMFRTALCPDRCGHAKDVAVFRIESYVDYQKPGKYGSEKQTTTMVPLKVGEGMTQQDPKVLEAIKDLKPGDRVYLDWDHLYVKTERLQSPEYPVIRIEKINSN